VPLRLRTRTLVLDRPVVMGVLNVTPDSFSDGGAFLDHDAALRRAAAMVAEGAAIIDVGGESTRPGSTPPSAQEEIDRVAPVVERIAREFDVAVSVDTSRAPVVEAALAAGAHLINDVRGLRDPAALKAAANAGAAVCIMHMQGDPVTMQVAPHYEDVVGEVSDWLGARIVACREAGIPADAIVIDPGFGFGKTAAHNVALFQSLEVLLRHAVPLLVGVSRKSLVGHLTGRPVGERLAGSVALAALAAERGASILRAHDVAATVDAVRVGGALRRAGGAI
jgi:dihydropteroate synthase